MEAFLAPFGCLGAPMLGLHKPFLATTIQFRAGISSALFCPFPLTRTRPVAACGSRAARRRGGGSASEHCKEFANLNIILHAQPPLTRCGRFYPLCGAWRPWSGKPVAFLMLVCLRCSFFEVSLATGVLRWRTSKRCPNDHRDLEMRSQGSLLEGCCDIFGVSFRPLSHSWGFQSLQLGFH